MADGNVMGLTDEDKANIDHVWRGSDMFEQASDWHTERAYLAGLRAGMERAAKICDSLEQPHPADYDYDYALRDCANAIRAAMGSEP